MTYNESPENLVEVNINLDCSCSIPCVGRDGMIGFRRAYPAGDSFLELRKIKVPKEVVVSQEELSKYLSCKQEEWAEEFVRLTNPNIWEGDTLLF